MSSANLNEVLSRAREGKFGVAAFDVVNTEYGKAIVDAAEAENSPVVLMIYEAYMRYFDLELLTPALVQIAHRADVPVVVHLDHATCWDTVVGAAEAGCTSVMLDSSSEPYDVNAASTREVVKLCRPRGISVESEIGCVGGDESIARTALAEGTAADEKYYTDPDEAARFVADTGVDALAVSAGNIHGLYKGTPHLHLALIREVAVRTGVPLVLHGGSGLSDQDFQNAIREGVCKINVNTSLIVAAASSLKNDFAADPNALNFPELLLSSYKAVSAESARLMRVFGCAGKGRVS